MFLVMLIPICDIFCTYFFFSRKSYVIHSTDGSELHVFAIGMLLFIPICIKYLFQNTGFCFVLVWFSVVNISLNAITRKEKLLCSTHDFECLHLKLSDHRITEC